MQKGKKKTSVRYERQNTNGPTLRVNRERLFPLIIWFYSVRGGGGSFWILPLVFFVSFFPPFQFVSQPLLSDCCCRSCWPVSAERWFVVGRLGHVIQSHKLEKKKSISESAKPPSQTCRMRAVCNQRRGKNARSSSPGSFCLLFFFFE